MDIKSIANQLLKAEETKQAISPLTEKYPTISVDEAYRIQLEQVDMKKTQGALVKGLKIGLTSKAMQEMLNVFTPDYGFILDSMVFSENDRIDPSVYIQPKVEFELAFFFKNPLQGIVEINEVISAIDYVVPAIEIIDSRIADWQIKFEDTVADNGSSAGVILGKNKISLSDIPDITAVQMNAYKNGHHFDAATSAAVLGNPLNAVVWLAEAVGEYGISIEPGMFVLSGAFSKAVPFEAGDSFKADFGQLGEVNAIFSKEVVNQ